jgi:hypothetical protein
MLYHWLLVVALVAGAAYADDDDESDDDCCSVEDKKELAFMWHSAWHSSHTDRKVTIMKEVWHDVLTKHPEAKDFLKAADVDVEQEDSPKFRAFLIRLVQRFDNIINLLEEPQVLEEQIHYMAEQYGTKVGLKKSYFEAVADAFEHVLPKVSSCFNLGAWHRCLHRLAQVVSAKVAED